MKPTLSFTFEVEGLTVKVKFEQGWTSKIPKRFQWAKKILPLPFLEEGFSRQTTSAEVLIKDGFKTRGYLAGTVRQSHKDFPSWEQGRFEALKKTLSMLSGKSFRGIRSQAFSTLKEMEELCRY